MEWSIATLCLEASTCPVVPRLGAGDRVRCRSRDGAPVAHATRELAGWQTLAPCRGGYLLQRDTACGTCPVRRLSGGLVAIDVEARADGLRIEVAAPDPAALAEAYHRLRTDGQRPRIVRGGRGPSAPGAFLNLGHLSRRQRSALEAARRIGYFETGGGGVDALAAELACGRSAAHEHLRRGMARLLDAVF